MTDTSYDPVHPYYRAILDTYAESGRPYYHQVQPDEAREMLRASLAAAPSAPDLPQMARLVDESVAGECYDIPVRRYQPPGEILGRCVYLHAGGWVIGDLDTGDAFCRRLAAGGGCEVISVDYRLAPEHPYPAALDDAFAVLQWASALSDEPLLIAGESAGGNLAAACAIRACEDPSISLAGQFLAYPVTDYTCSTRSYRELGECNYLLSGADMRWFWDHYCPASVDRTLPQVSPLHIEDTTGLPPTLICVAGLDPLRDEGLAYAHKLASGGVAVESRCDPGMLHGYLSAAGAVPLAGEAVRHAGDWVKRRLAEAEA